MAIDPREGFDQLVTAWNVAWKAGELVAGQGFWHAGNTLDTYVTDLVQANQKDAEGIVSKSYRWHHNHIPVAVFEIARAIGASAIPKAVFDAANMSPYRLSINHHRSTITDLAS
jgi:hypothetical protein